MGRKKGGGARTPNIEKNTLHSAQKIRAVDLVSSGEIHGFINGNDEPLKSIYLNGTPIQNNDGSLNFSGVRAEFNAGEEDQDYLSSFTSADRSVEVAARVKRGVPITRTVHDKLVTSVRVTVGVDALMRSTKEGDQLKTAVSMDVLILKDNKIHASKNMYLNEKGSKPFYHDIVFDDLPEAPFDIRCNRLTADSNDDLLKNDTYFFSYVESIDAKMRYPLSAVVGLEVDSAQFGNNLPVRTYGIKGCEVLVPSNYNPVTREYSGLWDRLFKPAYTNNPVWILYDLLTNPIDGFGSRDLKIDIDKFYEASKYCDELVDDGNGKKEPRFVCNAVIQGGKAYDVINNVCSSFRAVPAYNGEYFTIYYDRAHDITAIYNNSNVVEGLFTYSSTDRTEQYNQIQVQFADEENGYETTIEEVSDDRHIAKHGINTFSIVAFGATKRSYALRAAWWNLVTNLTEKEIVTFRVGAQGIKHEIYDIIQIADNDYVGESMGARIADIDGVKVTLDRDIENVKKLVIDTKDGIKTIDVKRQLSERELELAIAPNIAESAVCTAILDHVSARLFRCVSIAENDNGTFTITAVQHNPQKEAIVDNGATYVPENSTTINPTPSLSNGVADNDGRAIILRWDAMIVVGTENTYRIQLFRDKTLYQTFETKETFLELVNLPQGEYVAKIRALSANGQHSAELIIPFSTTYKIDGLRANPVFFGIELNWQLPALITTDAHTEIWVADVDDRSKSRLFASIAYPQNQYTINGLSIGDELYFWFRLVDSAGNQGEFSYSIKGEPKSDPNDVLEMLDGQISDKQISKELQDQFDTNIEEKIEGAKIEIGSELEAIDVDLTGINSEIDNIKLDVTDAKSGVQSAQKSADSALKSAKENAEKIKNNSEVIEEVKLENEHSKALFQLAQMSDMSAQHSNYARSMSMSGQVANNSARIEDIDSFVINEKEATASRFKEMNTRVDNAESTITSVKETLSSDIEAEASKREELKAEFDINEAKQLLSTSTHSNAERSIAQRLSSVSASTANAHASIDELENVVAEQDRAQTERMTQMQSEVNSNKSSIESVSKTVADNEKAQASKNDEFTAEFDTHSAKNLLSLQSQASGNFSLSQRYSLLSAQHANSVAKLEQLQKVFADSETSWAVTEQRLQSQIDSSVSEIARIEKVSNERDKSQALQNELFTAEFDLSSAKLGLSNQSSASSEYSLSQRYSLLSAQHAHSASKIERLEKAVADGEIAWSVSEERLQSEINSSKSEISRLDKTIAENDKAQSTAISNLTSKVSKAEADIASVKSTQANDKQALTEQINSANSKINSHSASITEIRKTQADTAGKVSTMWTMKVDGNGVIGGIMLGSDGHESMLKFAADNFIISTGDQSRNLFTIQRVNNRQVAALNVNDFILPGSLSADVIRANTKLSSPIIEGGRLSGGTITGGSLNIGNGACTIQSNGDFYARNGRFEGTVYANKIVGDLVSMTKVPANRTSFTLSAESFPRTIKFDSFSVRQTQWSDHDPNYKYIVGVRVRANGSIIGTFVSGHLRAGSVTVSLGYKDIPANTGYSITMEVRAFRSKSDQSKTFEQLSPLSNFTVSSYHFMVSKTKYI